MSLSYEKLTPIEVFDPRINVENSRAYAVLTGGSQVTYKQYTSTSIGPSSIQFSAPPPSGGHFVDRNVKLYLPVRLTFTGTPAVGQTLLRPGFDAPRAYPISGSLDTIQATINNQSVSVNMAEVIHPMTWFNTGMALKSMDFSSSPVYPDQFASYASGVGTNRNPLGDYGATSDDIPAPRGSFPFFIVANPVSVGASVTAIVDVFFCESIMLPPFWWGKGISSSAFFNATTMDFNLTFVSQTANRMWSHSDALGGVPFTSATWSFGGTVGGPSTANIGTGLIPVLLFEYITPKDINVPSAKVPITYPYCDIRRYITQLSAMPAFGAPGYYNIPFQSNSIQLSNIPRRIYAFARQQKNDLYADARNTDTYFSIESANVTFGNKNGLLASANKEQLYMQAVKNGYNGSWTQWSGTTNGQGVFTQVGTVGSILCIELATDIGLSSIEAPGQLQQTTLQIQLNITNINPNAITPELVIIVVDEGTFTMERLAASTVNVGVLTQKNVLDAQEKPGVDYKSVEDVQGGNFFTGLSNFGSKLNQFLRDSKILSNVVGPALGLASMIPSPASPFLKGLSAVGTPVAAALGYGEGLPGRRMMDSPARKAPRRTRKTGSGELDDDDERSRFEPRYEAHGGEALSRREMASRLLTYR